jgi:hypothetical protein
LDLLKTDCAQIKSEAEVLRTKIQVAEEKRLEEASKQEEGAFAYLKQLDDELEALRKKLKILEIQSEINLPDVRWKVANAMRMYLNFFVLNHGPHVLTRQLTWLRLSTAISWNRSGAMMVI